MTAGVPGAGIAGLFYLAGALLAPAWELARAWRGTRRAPAWRFVLRLAGVATGMLAGIYAVGLLIGIGLTFPDLLSSTADGSASAPAGTPHFIARAAVFLTFGTLALVLLAVEALRLVFSPRRSARRRHVLVAAAQPDGKRP